MAAATSVACAQIAGLGDFPPPSGDDASIGSDADGSGKQTDGDDAADATAGEPESGGDTATDAAFFGDGDGGHGCSGWLCNGVCVPDDVHNCGGCGNDCTALPHVGGAVTCSAGKCSVPLSSCAPGWLHCAGDPDEGCDTDITKPANCGACNTVCSGATPQCAQSASGFSCVSSCPGSASPCNGTCATTSTDPNNCGSCGHVCPPVAHGQPTCATSTCAFQCNAGYSSCGSACVDETTDDANCGACGKACTGGQQCVGSQCQCPGGDLLCGGVCVPNDAHNCGACGNDCTALKNVSGPANCVSGKCSIPASSCAPGWAHCPLDPDPGCDTNVSVAANCGACGNLCPSGMPQCSGSGGTYACVSGCSGSTPTLCDSACVDTTTDSNNCGACNNKCPAGTTCSSSQCVCTTASCGTKGCCSSGSSCDLYSNQNSQSCGTGGNACGPCVAPQTCGATMPGVCGCVPTGSCGSRNCGTVSDGCGHTLTCGLGTCGSGASCNGSGICQCNSGLTACASSCVNETTDPNNCGGCGKTCSSASGQACVGGNCVCNAQSCPNGCCNGNVCGPAPNGPCACGGGTLQCSSDRQSVICTGMGPTTCQVDQHCVGTLSSSCQCDTINGTIYQLSCASDHSVVCGGWGFDSSVEGWRMPTGSGVSFGTLSISESGQRLAVFVLPDADPTVTGAGFTVIKDICPSNGGIDTSTVTSRALTFTVDGPASISGNDEVAPYFSDGTTLQSAGANAEFGPQDTLMESPVALAPATKQIVIQITIYNAIPPGGFTIYLDNVFLH